jgi:hypothetical protein
MVPKVPIKAPRSTVGTECTCRWDHTSQKAARHCTRFMRTARIVHAMWFEHVVTKLQAHYHGSLLDVGVVTVPGLLCV